MGHLPPENNSLLRGIVGNVVFVKAKSGGTIVRSRPTKSKKAPSGKKRETWEKFSLVSGFITPVYPFLKESFTDLLGKKSARDAVRSYYLTEAVTQTPSGFELLYNKLLISTGRVRPYLPLGQVINGQQLHLQWTDNSSEAFAQPTDRLTLMLYLPDSREYLFFKDCAQRADAQLHLNLPDDFAGIPFYAWATFRDAATGTYANSTYLGLLG